MLGGFGVRATSPPENFGERNAGNWLEPAAIRFFVCVMRARDHRQIDRQTLWVTPEAGRRWGGLFAELR